MAADRPTVYSKQFVSMDKCVNLTKIHIRAIQYFICLFFFVLFFNKNPLQPHNLALNAISFYCGSNVKGTLLEQN